MIKKINNGYQNEYDFVDLFNGKKYSQLDINSQEFLKDLYGGIMDDSQIIRAWKNRVMQKTDIFIKFKNCVKGISIKCGNGNSMHDESVENFKLFLEKYCIPYKVINYYISYHYGYMRDELGNRILSQKLSSEEYKKLYQNEIDIFNKNINKTKIIIDMVDRFIIRGRNADYDVDALICGTINDYIWILKYDLYDLVLSKRCLDFTSPHVACMTIGPKKRLLNDDSKNIKDKYIVTIRWNNLRNDIINFKAKLGSGLVVNSNINS